MDLINASENFEKDLVPGSTLLKTKSHNIALDPNGNFVAETTSGFPDVLQTNIPLAAGETWESEIFDISQFMYIKTSIYCDKAGTFLGEWVTSDGLKVLRTFTLDYTVLEEVDYAAAPVFEKFLRLKFINTSGEDQSFLRIRSKISNVPLAGQVLRIDRNLPGNIAAQTVRSILTGKNEQGTYSNANVNSVGSLEVSSFLIDVSRGRYASYSYDVKFGRNPSTDSASAPEDIWSGGGLYTGQPITGTAQTLQVFSDNAADTAAGTGARTLRLIGLDSNYLPQTEDVILNGTTPVLTTKTWWRMSSAYVLTAGSGGANAGQITARHSTTTTNVFMVMPVRANQTSICADTVPAGKTRLITALYSAMSITGGSAGSANHRFLVREFGAVFRTIRDIEVSNALAYIDNLHGGILVPEKSDIKWQVFSVSSNNTKSTAEFEFLDIDN